MYALTPNKKANLSPCKQAWPSVPKYLPCHLLHPIYPAPVNLTKTKSKANFDKQGNSLVPLEKSFPSIVEATNYPKIFALSIGSRRRAQRLATRVRTKY